MTGMPACEICGRGADFGHRVSFAGNRSKRKRRPNLQKVNGYTQDGRRVRVACTRCIKAGKVVKAA